MAAEPHQVDALVREQKAALILQEKQRHQDVLQQRKAVQREGSHSPSTRVGKATDLQGTLTPRMSFERQLTDVLLKQLLEKVFNAADEDKTGKQTSGRCHFENACSSRFCFGCITRDIEDVDTACLLCTNNAGRLQHRQVAEMLFACPLGLTRWEFVQLLVSAQEDAGGWIEYEPFVEVSWRSDSSVAPLGQYLPREAV